MLAINPDDADIYKVRVVCFINLKDFDSALDSIGGREDLHFEQAYCLYRKNDVCKPLCQLRNSLVIIHVVGRGFACMRRYS